MNTTKKIKEVLLYHIYPLGACGAPKNRADQTQVCERLTLLENYLEHMQTLGVTKLYLGPVFESDSHGYDTRSYYHLDARLGTNETLQRFSNKLHKHDIQLILDAVFNHVGRGFWAFQDVLQNGQSSIYVNWFAGIDFSQKSPLGDPFTYQPWEGHYSLVKLNLRNHDLRHHLLDAVRFWITEFQIDGLRLDAADCVDKDFWKFLRREICAEYPEFYFMGEIIHGDYRDWANETMFHTTTNYTAYKGLWSSLNDKNYFEIAYTLNQQFGENGTYAHLPMYNFVDNHDVNRAASQLNNSAHLYLLYGMLFTMPGFPSLYYGSEVGLRGERNQFSDEILRPYFDPTQGQETWDHNLFQFIAKLAATRKSSHALKHGDYQELMITNEQFAYVRESEQEKIIIIFNCSDHEHTLKLHQLDGNFQVEDILNSSETFLINAFTDVSIPANWLRILRVKK